jgi:hypothetical protein
MSISVLLNKPITAGEFEYKRNYRRPQHGKYAYRGSVGAAQLAQLKKKGLVTAKRTPGKAKVYEPTELGINLWINDFMELSARNEKFNKAT